MFHSMAAYCNNHIQQMPKSILEIACTSAIYSFTASTLISGNIQHGTKMGTVAALVSMMSGFTLPFFRRYLADGHGHLSWNQKGIIQVMNLAMTHLLINSLTAYRVNLVGAACFAVVLNLLMQGFKSEYAYPSCLYILI